MAPSSKEDLDTANALMQLSQDSSARRLVEARSAIAGPSTIVAPTTVVRPRVNATLATSSTNLIVATPINSAVRPAIIASSQATKTGRDKHRTVTNRGEIFEWSDNPHITKAAMVKGTNQDPMLIVRLKSTRQKWFEFKYPRRGAINWDDKKEVLNANNWRWQIIRRTLDKNKQNLIRRLRWTDNEKNELKKQIKLRKPTNITEKEWAELERLFPDRNRKAIVNKFGKMNRAGDVEDSEEIDDDKSDVGVEVEEAHGEHLHHGLEDSSDDEKDDQQPAQPISSVFVSDN